jgi:hypothetical protein
VVYFIRAKDGGPVKIGSSIHLLLRLKQLQANSPVELELVAATEGSARFEREVHSRFQHCRLHGEWFEPIDELLNFMAEIGLPEELGEIPDYKAAYKSPWPYRPK